MPAYLSEEVIALTRLLVNANFPFNPIVPILPNISLYSIVIHFRPVNRQKKTVKHWSYNDAHDS